MARTFVVGVARTVLLLSLVSCSSCSITMTKNDRDTSHQYETLSQWRQSSLAHEGKIFLIGNLDATAGNAICQRLLVLDADDKVKRITLFINSGGGMEQGYMAICNTIGQMRKPVDTVNQAYCMSAACAVHQVATGKRYAYSNAEFLLHEVKLISKNVHSRKVRKKLLEYTKQTSTPRYEQIITQKSNLPEEWFPLTEVPVLFVAQEALEYGFIDEIIDADSSNEEAQSDKPDSADGK